MKRLYSGMLLSMLTLPVFARSDGALTSAFVKQSPRASSVAYRAFGAASAHKTSSATQSANTSIQKTDSVTQQADSAISETVNAEKEACLANNLATGNTFVYASINSNTSNYASMVEDVVNPGNNACYVRVNLTSSDSSVDLSDMPVRYFKMDKTVTCGQWVEEATLQERVLESKKKGRAWAIAGAAVGGAALGVGAMELFGNKLIGGKVEGQAALTGTELLCSQLKVLKEKDSEKYDEIKKVILDLKEDCESGLWQENQDRKPEECKEYDLGQLSEC